MAKAAPAPSVSNEIFNLIRGQEANFPFPAKKKTVTVGTFDAATGRFSYSVPTYKETFGGEPGDPGPLKPPKTLRGGQINAINAIEVILRFKLKNRTGDVAITIPGLPPVHTSTSDAVEVSVGAAESVEFTISSGSRRFTSELPLEIARFVAGAGVFELPAFPVAIIYAPPMDQGQRNVSRWTVTKTTGNTTSFSIGKENTTTHPVTPDFDNVNLIANEMKGAAQALDLLNKVFKDGAVEGISKALNIIAGGLGSASATESQGVSVNTQHGVTLSVANEQTITTNAAGGGPGSGDLIHYLKNVKLAWFTSSVGRIRVSIFGHDGIGVTSAGFLKNGGQTDLDPATVAEFLKLDPFVAGGPSAALPPERFVYLDTIDLNGGEITQVETYSLSVQDSKQTTTTHTHVQNNQPGFLKFLGLGVTDENSTQTVVTQGSTTQSQDTRTVSNTIDLFARSNERYSVEVYCDVVFGTFAYRQAGSSPTPALEGTVRGKDGKGAAGQTVTLINQGRKFTTRANSAGRYAFHAGAIKPGKSEVAAAGVKQTLTLAAGSMKWDIQA
jgi:hypothetical protein